MGTSGTRHRSTSPDPNVAWAAMKPADLPMSLTIPIPFGLLHMASVLAVRIAASASPTADWKPKVRSMWSISLSIVFGIPATETLMLFFMHSSWILKAPL